MPMRRIRAGGGLATDPSSLDQPEGLRVAENVALHRPGTIQPRPGFGDTTGIASRITSYRPIAIAPFDGDLVVQSYDGSAYRLERASADTQYTGTATPPDATVNGVSSFMEARGSLYLTTSSGVRKLVDIADAATTKAGAWMTYQPPALSTAPAADIENAALEADTSVAYRWCVVRTDGNGYEVRSAPSARVVFAPLTASTYANGLNMNVGAIHLPAEAVAGDVLELYRTRNSGDFQADPGEDYYLVGEYTITSTDVTNTVTPGTTWADSVQDHALGAALYSSASQFGSLSAKEVPPYCSALAQWGSVAWAGNITERAIEVVTLAKIGRWDSTAAIAINEGTGLCTLSGSYAGVSGDDLTGVTWTGAPSSLGWDSLVVGMWISDTSPEATTGRIPAGSRILAFDEGAQTITLDGTPSGSGTFNTGDILEVQSVEFFVYSTESLTARWIDVTHSDTFGSLEYQAACSLARVVTAYFAGASTPPAGVYALKDEVTVDGDGGIAFLSAEAGESFTLECPTRGSAFVPDLSTSVTVEAEERPGGLAWSAPDEPEAWPPANTAIVGKRDSDILALVPTRDALLVWKTDGLYSVTGSAPASWVISEVDTSLRLVAPQATCVLDGVCFALTDRGVVAATAGGVQVVSGPIAAELRLRTKLLPFGDTGPKRAFWMTAHQRLGLVVLGVGSSSSAETSSGQYVFHARAGGRWSEWTRRDRCAAYDPAEDRMVIAEGGSGWQLAYERAAENDSASYYDGSITGLSGTVASSVIAVAMSAFGAYTPKVGDVVFDSGKSLYARITERSSSGSDWLLTIDNSSFSASLTFTWYQSIACAVEWQAQHLPGLGSRWQEIHVALEGDVHQFYPSLSTWSLKVGGQPSQTSSASTVTAPITQNGAPYQVVRTGVPREIVRAYQMGPRIEINEAGVLWRAAELALHFTAQSPRIRR